jgi:hypothetical protein
MKKFENMTTSELKDEYVTLALGAMIFDSKTERRRKEISEEIDRREMI